MKIWKWALPLMSLALAGKTWSETPEEIIARGEYLAKMGDCAACHTSQKDKPFAGGLRMSTPVGDIFSTNITPDPETGIGDYRYQDFANALRKGIAKDGHRLYPAMPYPSFAKINDRDMEALYAWFSQKVTPVRQKNRDSEIPWPLSMRWPLAMWSWVYSDGDSFKPDSMQSGEWNRGAYLVQGLGHCGACHTPRGIAFQEKAMSEREQGYLTGGTLDNWHAPNLTGNINDGLGNWSQEEIGTWLKTGQNAKSAAFGPMAEVVENSTQYLSDEDASAIAVYLKSLSRNGSGAPQRTYEKGTALALIQGNMGQIGAKEYVDNCAACHRLDGKGYEHTYPPLAQNSALMSEDPSSLINIVLNGGKTPVTHDAVTGLAMPAFGWRLSDQQAADVVTFIRNGWGNSGSAVNSDQVKAIREKQVNQQEQ